MMRRVVPQATAIVRAATGTTGDRHARSVAFIRDLLKGFDDDHVQYMIAREIPLWSLVPPELEPAGTLWLMKNADLANQSRAELLTAFLEARPGLRAALRDDRGALWVWRLVDPLGDD